MALQTLLAKFPKYSARKVRRLAEHLEFLSGSADYLVSRQIAEDLQAYHLLQAKMESQMNDDVRVVESDEAIRLQGERVHAVATMSNVIAAASEGTIEVTSGPGSKVESTTERICVTPVVAARNAVDDLAKFCRTNSDIRLHPNFDGAIKRVHGIINGQSFYTDRTVIQARLSPQDELPFDGEGK